MGNEDNADQRDVDDATSLAPLPYDPIASARGALKGRLPSSADLREAARSDESDAEHRPSLNSLSEVRFFPRRLAVWLRRQKLCPSCGSRVSRGRVRCPACGRTLREDLAAQARSPRPPY